MFLSIHHSLFISLFLLSVASCHKANMSSSSTVQNFHLISSSVDGVSSSTDILYNVKKSPIIQFIFSDIIDRNTITSAVSFTDASGKKINYTTAWQNADSSFIIIPSSPLNSLTKFSVNISSQLKSVSGKSLQAVSLLGFITSIDSTNKFPVISDDSLLTLVQKQTFKYFWDFGHPVSGLARERNNGDAETVTSGGSGFGIMCIPVAVNRNFITRSEGLARMQKIVSFLQNTAEKFHGAFPHWLNGSTGKVIPFSPKDNGADIVETSYLMSGLLSARQYFSGANADETNLRNDITALYNAVEWDWFRQGNQNVLYWHWSPDYNWAMNMPVRGWNECLITYILAASSSTHGIPKTVYDEGWAENGAIIKNTSYYNFTLPLGEAYGGPLFFSHYSFLGIDPDGLKDAYADYQTQTTNHTKINYSYCVDNPKKYFGYSNSCWGLTASDIQDGYTANSPTNDVGVIAPTAALSSFPYTPAESMQALKFFYYTLGDKIWGDYGFADAFSLKDLWYANSYLAIDEGPVVIMIENYRSGLVWNLLTSCPEIKNGMKKLGFSAPYL